jgi:hypothetical protein
MSLFTYCLFAQSLGVYRLPRYTEKNNPRNINYMPVVIFTVCLDLERKSY